MKRPSRRTFLGLLASASTTYFLPPKNGWLHLPAELEPLGYALRGYQRVGIEYLLSGVVILADGSELIVRPGDPPLPTERTADGQLMVQGIASLLGAVKKEGAWCTFSTPDPKEAVSFALETRKIRSDLAARSGS
jgi:hypothetical protein